MNRFKNILKVYKRDIKSLRKNFIAIVIIMGVCVLPSLYAWINIKACWNTYENTGTIPIAVINNDKGASFKDKELNIGNEVVDKLKSNNKIGWKFTNKREADMGVVDGTYYATIEIPEDFSSDIASILSDNPKHPELIYKVDTKENPVAGKITGMAKTTLINEITTNFVTTVNTTIFSSVNGIGRDLEKNKNDIIKLKDSIITMNKNMDLILAGLETANTSSKNLNEYLAIAKTTFPEVANGLKDITSKTSNTTEVINETKNIFNHSFYNIELTLNQAMATNKRVEALSKELVALNNESSSSDINKSPLNLVMDIDATNKNIDSIVRFLQTINNIKPNVKVSNLIESLNNIKNALNEQKQKLVNIQEVASNSNKVDNKLIDDLNQYTSGLNKQIQYSINTFRSTTKGELNYTTNNLEKSIKDAGELIKLGGGLNTQIENLLETSSKGTALSEKVSGDLLDKLKLYKGVINEISKKLELVSNDDLIRIISILQNNPILMAQNLAYPFNVKEEPIYHIPNYGSSMAPIYSVLALWVGTLILASLLKTEAVDFEGSENITIRQKYFGKMLTFITLAAIQGVIVALGNKIILGVYTVNFPLMIMFSLISSITFVIITYTLVALFSKFGTAMSIVLLILQVAGSGGSYPIQVDPLIFRILQPFFPFTYSIGGFRESIGGPLMSSVMLDFMMLILMAIVFILIGFFLKSPLHHKVNKFDKDFKASGISE
ncbi:YhgE/Pip domain-containing protein [Clostridium sp. Marseille-Q2269]|uniref:YhgE/Pip domain-containing protein n=1 Tax=Clostridium sp. Marseille-Q2269 TaxID=2942205 RepID=UPI00207494FC|nr:YhgE/Pip domain-containing protein [Clostridium sp. Marseille-Q2269]